MPVSEPRVAAASTERHPEPTRRLPGLAPVAALIVAAAALPYVVPSYLLTEITIALTFTLAAIGLTVLAGSTKQVSLGHGGFMALGAYVATVLADRAGVSFLAGAVVAAAVAALAGVAIGLPTLRLHGPYLALSTLAFGVAIQQLIAQWDSLTGGSFGMSVPTAAVGPVRFESPIDLYHIVLVFVIAGTWVAANVLRSPTGRKWRAVGQSEIASQVLGLNLALNKTAAFAFSAAFAGVAGALYAQVVGYVAPESFGLFASVFLLAIAVVGGAGSLAGALVAGLALNLPQQIASDVRALPAIIYGVALLAILGLVPAGIGPGFAALRVRWTRER